jgi:hypothetical protein
MDDCIVFKGGKNKQGYGCLTYSDVTLLTHRIAWMLDRGECIPRGKVVMHSCDNPPCINPRHLKLGTHKENNQDMIDKGRMNWGRGGRPIRMTEADVQAINNLRQQGMTAKQACKEIGFSRAHYNYRNRIGF